MMLKRIRLTSPKLSILILGSALALLILRWSPELASVLLSFSAHKPAVVSHAQNATLGFGAIYVATEDNTTWRVQGLVKAANLTGVWLTIPVQRRQTDEEVLKFTAGLEAEESVKLDAVRLSLNYIFLLEDFLRSGHETALFVEDDVDFGIDIKSQMKALSRAMLDSGWSNVEDDQRHEPSAPPQVGGPQEQLRRLQLGNVQHPYGESHWDILWLGHCGMEFTPQTEETTYTDPHALPWDRLTCPFNSYYADQKRRYGGRVEPQQQRVMSHTAPLCTFAWALTRSHADRIVYKFRNERVYNPDMALHIDCKGLKQRCTVVLPEVMHHHRVDGGRAITDNGEDKNDTRKRDLAWWEMRHKYTYNVEWSARCNAARSGESPGDRWQCLPGKFDDIM